MASLNRCTFIGNLGADPEQRFMPDSTEVSNFSIGCSESFKNKEGIKQERTEWVRVSIIGKLAGIANEYLKKGSPVYIEGRMQTRKWTTKEGQDRYSTEIVANHMQMLGSKGDRAAGEPEKANGYQPEPYGIKDDDDMPF